jgi:hypothetical protein
MGALYDDCIARYKPDEAIPLQKVLDEYGSCIWDFQEYQDKLYTSADFGRMYRSENGINWSRWPDDSTILGIKVWEIEYYDSKLFIGSDNFLYYQQNDVFPTTSCWQIPRHDTTNSEEIISMLSAGNYLFLGTGSEFANNDSIINPSAEGNVFVYDGQNFEKISDGLENETSGIQCIIKVDAAP